MKEKTKYTNRLIQETSPYLLQHAHNPVNWYPWGEEALGRAKKEDKPILVSIGYSACHWCHVMEKECFENEAIAQIMNERFVNIKVDREERPDLDEIYMNAAQVMTGSGGWPLNVFLTPDLVPFHAGTYFPPEDRSGMPGFPKILAIVSDYYMNHRSEVDKIKSQLQATLQQIAQVVPSKADLDAHVFDKAYEALESQFDPTHGGFSGAPKFPNPMFLSFLLRYWKRAHSDRALSMVEMTLEKMASGGLYDQIGGGFHRYSVDDRWLIPHFEKMLYDNALLSQIYAEAYQATKQEKYRRVVEEVLDYVLREMTSPEGGFYSAQDADSEGKEGKFYVWTRDEIKKILGKEKGTPFSAYYGVTPQGNFEEGSNVLHIPSSPGTICDLYGLTLPNLEELLENGRQKLLSEREKRVKPSRDEKILASWNGLMISGLISGFKVTENRKYLQAAEKATSFILHKMKRNGLLMRVFSKGKSHVNGYSEDYAFFIQALLDLYEATFEIGWLKEADGLNREMIRQFWDKTQGGFFFSGEEHERLITRSKHPYDNVIPSSNSVGVFNLLKLGYLIGDDSLKQKAEQTLRLFYGFLSEHPSGFTMMLSGLSLFLNPEEIGVIGSKQEARTQALLKEIHQAFLPDRILSLMDPQEPLDKGWLPFLTEKGSQQSPTAFVCKNFTCLPPVRDEKELKKLLS